jgi:hypothetical protein
MPAPLVEVVVRSGAHDDREAFDYACGKARADAIDRLVISVFDDRGWSVFDEALLKRVVVEHAGPTRARVLVDGLPVTAWWNDRFVETPDELVWKFLPEG